MILVCVGSAEQYTYRLAMYVASYATIYFLFLARYFS